MSDSQTAQTDDDGAQTEIASRDADGSADEASAHADADTQTELTRDDMFHVLQCRRRRLVLKYLQEYDGDGPARMSDIAEHIAAVEHDTTVDALQSQERQRVYIALYQSHLLKMDKVGIINYNQSRGYVEATPLAERFAGYLGSEPSLLGDGTDDDGRPGTAADITDGPVDQRWYRRYLYAAGGSLAVFSALASGVLPMPSTQFGVGILVSVLFALLATSHWLSESSPEFARTLPERLRN
ncbi:DUF7344 domain-containing protein [Haloarcula onubensis]|uniref:DUF7344 domain-containing protein n=1 Tax=Haloarcula onubensis TaxID=2950539 RepID=A0ABU2FR35_9EURY|nr:hypothetical protein [Halomicroarcula sp. S3CR25-11]MDS0282636.1 hypothetical protein [Halomicroarcula sp. S3CR25-11]